MQNIYLVGMRGVGKTTIGHLLAKKLGKEFIDSDALVESTSGKKVSDIVALEGWDAFRQLERQVIEELVRKQDMIVGTGGGVLMHFDNAEQMKKSGKLVLLTASIEILKIRLESTTDRPSLTGVDFLQELEQVWIERKDRYQELADQIINTEDKAPEKIVEEIIREL